MLLSDLCFFSESFFIAEDTGGILWSEVVVGVCCTLFYVNEMFYLVSSMEMCHVMKRRMLNPAQDLLMLCASTKMLNITGRE